MVAGDQPPCDVLHVCCGRGERKQLLSPFPPPPLKPSHPHKKKRRRSTLLRCRPCRTRQPAAKDFPQYLLLPLAVVHAGHSTNVCSAESSLQMPQWWHSGVGSRPMRHRNFSKHPCPAHTEGVAGETPRRPQLPADAGFGKFLCRIGREPTPECHHCGICSEDSALHTLVECPAWATQRRDLAAAVDAAGSLSLPAVVSCMVGSEEGWNAVASYCEDVMVLKEAAEREREAASSLPARSRRGGRRRVADLRPP
ncbi:hypothetical protein B5X24_HaOG207396 [Helicoverpa armigera]|uniref:Uncharacterized protein n=1 Tax=Helicoverpa armigera TaxID=29058 RepID=A0A2W1BPH3_HELAM|nr:hypothetical protein B5X24_HaOG207396 [Helicoverpa armigera]